MILSEIIHDCYSSAWLLSDSLLTDTNCRESQLYSTSPVFEATQNQVNRDNQVIEQLTSHRYDENELAVVMASRRQQLQVVAESIHPPSNGVFVPSSSSSSDPRVGSTSGHREIIQEASETTEMLNSKKLTSSATTSIGSILDAHEQMLRSMAMKLNKNVNANPPSSKMIINNDQPQSLNRHLLPCFDDQQNYADVNALHQQSSWPATMSHGAGGGNGTHHVLQFSQGLQVAPAQALNSTTAEIKRETASLVGEETTVTGARRSKVHPSGPACLAPGRSSRLFGDVTSINDNAGQLV
jgi:hypothetical protein